MEVHLDMWLAKANRQDSPEGVFAIRTYSKDRADRVLQRYKTLRHKNLVTATEFYRTADFEEHLFVVSEYTPFTLNHVDACVRQPSDAELATIMGQVCLAAISCELIVSNGLDLTWRRISSLRGTPAWRPKNLQRPRHI